MGWRKEEWMFDSRQEQRFFCSSSRPDWLLSPTKYYPMSRGVPSPGINQPNREV
jgi:hypothetical protein